MHGRTRPAPAGLTIRMDEGSGHERSAVWSRVSRRLSDFLDAQGTGPVSLELADERPRPHPRNGKLRHVMRTFS